MAHQAPFRFDPVMRPRDLPHRIVEGLDPDVIRIKGEGQADLPGGTSRNWGTITSTTKRPPGSRYTSVKGAPATRADVMSPMVTAMAPAPDEEYPASRRRARPFGST